MKNGWKMDDGFYTENNVQAFQYLEDTIPNINGLEVLAIGKIIDSL